MFQRKHMVLLGWRNRTVPEIATITGHALKSVEAMLDRHYLGRDIGLAESAISKLEKHRPGT